SPGRRLFPNFCQSPAPNNFAHPAPLRKSDNRHRTFSCCKRLRPLFGSKARRRHILGCFSRFLGRSHFSISPTLGIVGVRTFSPSVDPTPSGCVRGKTDRRVPQLRRRHGSPTRSPRSAPWRHHCLGGFNRSGRSCTRACVPSL